MSDFKKFSKAVFDQFTGMQTEELYVVDTSGFDLFEAYLEFFPEGTNPIFRERTEHDCSCCKQFIRNIGNVVSIVDGDVTTVWDIEGLEAPYDTVARELSYMIKSQSIDNVFRVPQPKYGAEHTIELVEGNQTKKWHHFHAAIASRYVSDEVDTVKSKYMGASVVFRRGLDELSKDALSQIADLIRSNSLYRGEEHLDALKAFMDLKHKYDIIYTSPMEKDIFVWANISNRFARFRNTVIGSLAVDLSEGVDLEKAVKSFEAKVAPANYKRTTSLITPQMVDSAMEKIKELDLEPALERRFANITDVSVNNVLFVDNSVQERMKDGVAGLLMEEAKPKTSNSKQPATDISVESFFSEVLPNSRSVKAFVETKAARKFVSLTAPSRDGVNPLFKWDNNFGWSYDGNITDSIKERVKRAGGNVDAALRISLAWFNSDDLDIHVRTPDGTHIYYQNKRGILDVDMNAGGVSSREPVENMQWVRKPADGIYKVDVQNYSKRESIDVGFSLEVECKNGLQSFSYERGLTSKETVRALELSVKDGCVEHIVNMSSNLVHGSSSIEKWGINTEQFVDVNSVMLSPNHWDGNSSGNKHWFFLLKDCKNPEKARGIYNEFLKPELDAHRKVFEVLGEKTKCDPDCEQLSGLGFSSTQRDNLLVLVDGRPFNIQF